MKFAKDRVIQPYLLFQIFIVVSKSGELSLEEGMSLSSFTPAPFEEKEVFHKAE